MSLTNPSRRSVLTRIISCLSGLSILSACGFSKNTTDDTAQALIKLLRHHGIAAHLGRLNTESDTRLQSLSLEQLVMDILTQLGIDAEQISDIDLDSLRERLDQKIRQDFMEENVVAVDGWLLSQTEAKLCALLYRKQHKPAA